MKKRSKIAKLSRNTNERKQLFRGLIADLVNRGVVTTSEAKAKAIRPQIEKLVTLARDQSLNAFRRLVQKTGSVKTAQKLLEIGKLFVNRPGGYVRLLHVAPSAGNNGKLMRMEWVEKITVYEEVKTPPTEKTETVSKKTAIAKNTKQSKQTEKKVKPKRIAKK